MAAIFAAAPSRRSRASKRGDSKELAIRRAFAHHRLVTRRNGIPFVRVAAAVLVAALHAPLPRASSAQATRAAEERSSVETVFYNGTIHTMDPGRPLVEALSVGRGRIVSMGSSAELLADCSAGAARIDSTARSR